MSSSIGGGFGGSGSQGTIRYAIVIDDSQVNSKLQNFQSRLGQLESATQSSGSGLTTINTNLQTMHTNLETTSTDLDAINNNFRSMDSSVQSTSREMGALSNNFKGVAGGLTEMNTLQGQVGNGTQTLGQRMKTAGGFIKDNALAVSLATSNIIGLVSSYTSLQKSQVAADRAQVMAERTQQRVVKLQEKLNKMVNEGKQGTKEYAIVQKDLEIAQDAAAIAAQRAALTTQTANEQTAQFMSTLPGQAIAVVSSFATMTSGFRDLGLTVPKFKEAIKGLTTSLGNMGLAGAFAALSIPVASFITAIIIGTNVTNVMKDAEGELEKAIGKTLIKMSAAEYGWLSLNRTLGTISDADRKRLEQYEKQAKVLEETESLVMAQIPAWEKLSGSLSPETIEKISKALKDAGVTIKGDLIEALEDGKIGSDELGTSVEQTTKKVLDFRTGLEPLPAGISASALALNEMNKPLDVLKEGSAAANLEIEGMLSTLKFSEPRWDKQIEKFKEAGASSEITTEEINALNDALEDGIADLENYIKEWEQFAEEFNDPQIFSGLFNFGEKFNVDEMTEDLIKGLPSKLEKKLKGNIKLDLKIEATEDSVQTYINSLIDAVEGKPGQFIWDPDLDVDDQSATDYAKNLIEKIDDEFGKGGKNAGPELKGLRDKLAAAIDRGASESEIKKILTEHIEGVPDMTVAIDQTSIDAIVKALENLLTNNGKGYAIKTTGFEMDEADWEAAGLGEGSDYPGDHPFNKGNVVGGGTDKDKSTLLISGSYVPGKGYVSKTPKDTAHPDFPNNLDWYYRMEQYMNDAKTPKNKGYYTPGDTMYFDPVLSGVPTGDLNIYSKDMAARAAPIFPNGGFLDFGNGGLGGRNGMSGTGNNIQYPMSLGGSGGQQMNELDKLARQIVQITNNLNTFARAIVTVTKDINQWARATVTQTKDNDQLARTISQLTKNNNQYARTSVTVTKDLNQYARATAQNTKNNNTFAKTIVETSKDFNTMARTIVQNTKNLNTFARAVNQTTNNVEKLADALNSIPRNVKSTISVGLRGAGAPFIEQLI